MPRRLIVLSCAIALGVLAIPATATAVTLKPGDILVVDRDSTDTFGAVIRVDPITGRQSLVSDNTISGSDLFEQPQDIALTASGRLFVSDRAAEAVIEVNPTTGEQRLVSNNAISGPDLLGQPHRLVVTAAGRILLTDNQSQDGSGAVIEVNPATGQQRAVSNNAISGPDLFEDPDGIALTSRGALIADRDSTDTFGAVIEMNPATGQQRAVSNNAISGPDLLSQPNGIAITPAGRILVADFSTEAVIGVDPATGQQALVSNNAISGPDLLEGPSGLRYTGTGRVLVADISSQGSGAVIEVNPATGQQRAVSSNAISGPDLFEQPGGLLVVPPKCFGRFATIVGDPSRNVLRGTKFADVVVGLGGRDRIIGKGGNDRICGGRGNDTIRGGKGRDRVAGQNGGDKLLGGRGGDILRGGKGRDVLTGGPGRDRLLGGPGPDRLLGGPGRDRLRGGPGRDRQRQ